IWLARYFESRRAGEDVHGALVQTHRSVWIATLTASAAAAVAYASLMITDFRGFRDFGLIGGAGMMLCWLGSILVLPAFIVVTERIAPLRFQATVGTQRRSVWAGIASLILRIPRPILVVSAVLGAATVALTAWA